MRNIKSIYHFLQQVLAKYYFKLYPNIEVIGVTGSVGKTTTKEMIRAVLSSKYNTLATHANIDPIYNIPLTIFKLKPGVEKLVLELSIDRPGDMDKYFWMVRPSIGVFTPIYWTHTEFLGDLAGVIKEKGKLAKVLGQDGSLILNKDDKSEIEIAKKTKAKVYYYGLDKSADIYAQNIKDNSLAGVSFDIFDKKTNESVKIRLKLLGYQNITSSLAAALVGRVSGLSLIEIKRELEMVKALPARMNVIKLMSGACLIDDSYNSNPLAAIAALETVAKLNLKGKKIAVLGEMKELGDYGKMGHREVGKSVAENNFDVLIVFGELTKYLADEVKKLDKKIEIYQAESMDKIITLLRELVGNDDVVLLKGSRFAHMERITLGLKGKEVRCNNMTCKKYTRCEGCNDL